MTGGIFSRRHVAVGLQRLGARRARVAIRMLVLATAATAGFATCGPAALAASPGDPTSSRAAREEAIKTIPWNQIPEAQRHDAQNAVQNVSIYRRLPTRVIDCDPDLFTFLLRHPDVVVDVWKLMGISKVTLERGADQGYHGSDGSGTTGNVSYLYTSWGQDANNVAVIYADGVYEGKPFITPMHAQSVLLLQSGGVQESDGRHQITVRVDSFVHIDQMGVELVAKTVQPWLNKTADQNFVETLNFISTFSRTAEKNPQGMQRLAGRLKSLDDPTRNELVHLCYRTSQRYAIEDQPALNKPYVLAQRADTAADAR